MQIMQTRLNPEGRLQCHYGGYASITEAQDLAWCPVKARAHL